MEFFSEHRLVDLCWSSGVGLVIIPLLLGADIVLRGPRRKTSEDPDKDSDDDSCWVPPPPGMMKLNIASIEGGGYGFLYRDHTGRVDCQGSGILDHIGTQLENDAETLRIALEAAKDKRYEKLIIETENQQLVDILEADKQNEMAACMDHDVLEAECRSRTGKLCLA